MCRAVERSSGRGQRQSVCTAYLRATSYIGVLFYPSRVVRSGNGKEIQGSSSLARPLTTTGHRKKTLKGGGGVVNVESECSNDSSTHVRFKLKVPTGPNKLFWSAVLSVEKAVMGGKNPHSSTETIKIEKKNHFGKTTSACLSWPTADREWKAREKSLAGKHTQVGNYWTLSYGTGLG